MSDHARPHGTLMFAQHCFGFPEQDEGPCLSREWHHKVVNYRGGKVTVHLPAYLLRYPNICVWYQDRSKLDRPGDKACARIHLHRVTSEVKLKLKHLTVKPHH